MNVPSPFLVPAIPGWGRGGACTAIRHVSSVGLLIRHALETTTSALQGTHPIGTACMVAMIGKLQYESSFPGIGG